MANVIIDNVCRELPLRKFASKNEYLKLFNKDTLEIFIAVILEKPAQIFE